MPLARASSVAMRATVWMVPAAEAPQNKAKLSTANAGRGVFTDDLMKVEDIKNGYCTQFLIHKEDGASAAKMRAFAESNGDSVVCIEDDDVINLHVHTADPGKILSEAIKYGYLTNFKIENMHEQFLARQKQGKSLEKQAEAEQKQKASDSIASEFIYAAVDPSRDYGFVAVAAGEGLKAVFTDLAVDAVVSGGQTMNPATEDILAAVQSVPAKTVFVLPNNKNIIMAAEQAEKLADRKVVVLPTRTIPMGITAMLNFDPTASVEANTIAMMKDGARIINLARGGLVNDDAVIAAIESGKVACYVTDFPNNKILQGKNVVAIPHLGASTPESEENCAVMAAQQLRDYLENGNITNSVNLPTLVQPWSGECRLCIIHRNVPGAIASITGVLSKDGVNVENMTNKSKKDYAYTVVDVGSRVSDAVASEIRALDGVLRVRLLNH